MPKAALDERYVQLGAIIRSARERHGVTQTNLATKMGRQQSWLSKCERGELELGVFSFLDLTTALGESPSKLLRSLGKKQQS